MSMLGEDGSRRQIEIDLLKETSDLFNLSRVVSVSSQSNVMDTDSVSTSSSLFDIFDKIFGTDDEENNIVKQTTPDGTNEHRKETSPDKDEFSIFSEEITNYDDFTTDSYVTNFDEPNKQVCLEGKIIDLKNSSRNFHDSKWEQIQGSNKDNSFNPGKRRGHQEKDPIFQQKQKKFSSSNIFVNKQTQNQDNSNKAHNLITCKSIKEVNTLAGVSMNQYGQEAVIRLKNKRVTSEFNHNKFSSFVSPLSKAKPNVSGSPFPSLHTYKKPSSNVVRRRGRPKRDPTEGWPKRPLSGYNIFFKHERKRLRYSSSTLPPPHNVKETSKAGIHSEDLPENHCAMTFVDLAKKIGSNWKKLTEAERAFYNTLAEPNMNTYREELKAFLAKRQQEAK